MMIIKAPTITATRNQAEPQADIILIPTGETRTTGATMTIMAAVIPNVSLVNLTLPPTVQAVHAQAEDAIIQEEEVSVNLL